MSSICHNFGKRQRDVAWEHGEIVNGNRFHWKCKWCGHSRRSGGAYRLKKHLAGGYEVASCLKVPSDVADSMRRLLTVRQKERDEKRARRKLTENLDLDYQHAGADMGEECGLSDRDGMHTPTAPEQSRVEQWEREQMAMKEQHGTMLCNGTYARLNHHWKNVLEHLLQSPDMCGDGGIRNCIQKALTFSPLEFTGNLSIHAAQTKDNFKDHGELEGDAERPNTWNAAKRCKEVVLDRSYEDPNDQTDACINTKKCQNILFSLLVSDKFASLCDSLCGNFRDSKACSIIDFSLINSRMKHGVYERSTGLFDEDIQQVWKNIQKSGEEIALLSSSLSIFSRTSYQRLVGEDSAHVVGESNYEERTNQVGAEEKDSMDSYTTTPCPRESNHSTEHNGSSVSGMESDELSQPSRTAMSRLCKQCGTREDEDKRFLVCGNVRCFYKYYHIRCLKSAQLASRQQQKKCCWYCPSCLCRACLSDRDDEKIVLCDGCDEAYHIYCMKPALATIPEGTWYCSLCNMARARRGMRRYEQWALQQQRKENVGNASGADMSIDILLSAAEKLRSEEKLAVVKAQKRNWRR